MAIARRTQIVIGAAASLSILAAGFILGIIAAHAPGEVVCTANPCRITMTRNGTDGLVIQDASGPKVENALLIIDPAGIPELWQNAAGAYEGPKGEICTTDAALAPVACLGSNGARGWLRIGGQTLTAADIAWLHHAEQASGARAGAGR